MSDAKWHFMLYFFEVNTSLWGNSADEVIRVLDGRQDGRLAYSIRHMHSRESQMPQKGDAHTD